MNREMTAEAEQMDEEAHRKKVAKSAKRKTKAQNLGALSKETMRSRGTYRSTFITPQY
jgi:hypothetical protein